MQPISAVARAEILQFSPQELGTTLWAFARLQSLPSAWDLLENSKLVGVSGFGALWAYSEERRWSRRALAREIQLLLRCARGSRRAAFLTTAAARAAEAGDTSRAIFLLQREMASVRASGAILEDVLLSRILRGCGQGEVLEYASME